MLSELGLTVSCSMVLEEDCVASESVSGGWTVEDSVLETWSDPEVSLLQAEKLKRSIPARKKGQHASPAEALPVPGRLPPAQAIKPKNLPARIVREQLTIPARPKPARLKHANIPVSRPVQIGPVRPVPGNAPTVQPIPAGTVTNLVREIWGVKNMNTAAVLPVPATPTIVTPVPTPIMTVLQKPKVFAVLGPYRTDKPIYNKIPSNEGILL